MMHSAKAFTLLELLLAMTLLSLIMVLAYSGLSAGIKVSASGEKALDMLDAQRTTHQFLRQQLRQVMPLVIEHNEEAGMPIVFEGSADRMRFVAPMPGYLGFGGPQVQTLWLEREDGGFSLYFSHHPLNLFEGTDFSTDAILLQAGLAEMIFEYAVFDPEGQLESWQDAWEDSSHLPLLVAIRGSYPDEQNMRWPDLLVAPLAESYQPGFGPVSRPNIRPTRPIPGLPQVKPRGGR